MRDSATSRRPALTMLVVAALCHPAPGQAQEAVRPPSHYAPYAFLVGRWAISAEGGAPMMNVTFRWGPGQSYLWYSAAFLVNGVEEPHFEGLLLWNGVRRNFDVLIALDLAGGRTQEQGEMRVDPDGTVIREVTATYSEGTQPIDGPRAGPSGATGRFRQTFRQLADGRVNTQVLRQTATGWKATFAGSDNLVMTPLDRVPK